MKEINLEINNDLLKTKRKNISFTCELHENLQQAMNDFIDKRPNMDQYRFIQSAIAIFLMNNGFDNRNLRRLYIGNVLPNYFQDK